MKKHIALLIIMVLALSLALFSCDKKDKECLEHVDEDMNFICNVCELEIPEDPKYLGFEGYYQTEYEPYNKKVTLSNYKVLNELNGMTVRTDYSSYYYGQPCIYGDLIVLDNNNASAGDVKSAIVNTKLGTVVLMTEMESDTAETETAISVYKITDDEYILLKIEKDYSNVGYTKATTTIYNAEGTKIASTSSKSNVVSPVVECDNIFRFAGKVYQIEDGAVTYMFDKEFREIPHIDYKTDKYYYVYYSSSEIHLYDLEYKFVKAIDFGYAYDRDTFVLENGNILIQNTEKLPEDAEEFDYEDYYEGENHKFKVTHAIYNVETGEKKEVEFGYVIETLYNKVVYDDFGKYFTEKVKNLARIIKFEDYSEYCDDKLLMANMDSEIRIYGFLGNEVPSQGANLASIVDDGRYIVRNTAGVKYLLNEKGEIISEITDAIYDNYAGYMYESKFFDPDGNIFYDSDLNVIADSSEFGYEYWIGSGAYEIYKNYYELEELKEDNERVEYYLFDGNKAPKKIDLSSNVESEISIVTYSNNYFSYYLTTTDDEVETTKFVVRNVDAALVCSIEVGQVTSSNGQNTKTTSINNIYTVGDQLLVQVREYTYDSENYTSTTSYKYYCIK